MSIINTNYTMKYNFKRKLKSLWNIHTYDTYISYVKYRLSFTLISISIITKSTDRLLNFHSVLNKSKHILYFDQKSGPRDDIRKVACFTTFTIPLIYYNFPILILFTDGSDEFQIKFLSVRSICTKKLKC